MYYYLLKREQRGNPRCSLPIVPISSSLLQTLTPPIILKVCTFPSPHDHQYYQCSPFILFIDQFALNLLPLPCIFCGIPVLMPQHITFIAVYCHLWVTSGLSDRNDCSCSCPLYINIYTDKKHFSWHFCNLLSLLTTSSASPSKEEGIWCTFSEVYKQEVISGWNKAKKKVGPPKGGIPLQIFLCKSLPKLGLFIERFLQLFCVSLLSICCLSLRISYLFMSTWSALWVFFLQILTGKILFFFSLICYHFVSWSCWNTD